MPAVKKIPMRQCLGCKELKPKKELIRVVKNSAGEVSLDLVGKKPGKGAYICKDIECFRKARKSKSFEEVAVVNGDVPEWFKRGVEYALYAPTAMNQQKFKFYLDGNKVRLKYALAFYGNVDKGIVKYHFELGAGKENFFWVD